MRRRVVYYTGVRIGDREGIRVFHCVAGESRSFPKARTCPPTVGPSKRLAPVHRQQVLPKSSHMSTDNRSFQKDRNCPPTAGPSKRLAPVHRQQVLPKGSHLSTYTSFFRKARTYPPNYSAGDHSLPYHLHKNLKPRRYQKLLYRVYVNSTCWEVESNNKAHSHRCDCISGHFPSSQAKKT